MPKIILIINRLIIGGPIHNVAYLTKYLSPEYEAFLMGGKEEKGEKNAGILLREQGIEPIIIPDMHRPIHFLKDWHAYNKIRSFIREFRPDIVHTHASKAGTLGRMAAVKEKVPVIIHTFHGHVFHSYFSKPATFVYEKIEQWLATKTTKIIAVSQSQKQELSQVYKICKPEKIEVIPIGFDLDKFQQNKDGKRKSFRNQYGVDDEEVAIGIVGRLVPIKKSMR